MVVYIAGPYTAPTRDGVQANIDKAEEVAKAILQKGLTPLLPHKITSFWDEDPQFAHMQHSDWIYKVCIPLLDKCDVIVMVPGWRDSPGSVIEHQHASKRGIPILYFGKQ
jgi:nucleoside 2-deoxyribosyltransferase